MSRNILETIQKKSEIRNIIVGSRKISVERLTRLDNSSENMWIKSYIWRTDPECSKEKQQKMGNMIKGLKDMEDRIRSYNLITFQVERIKRKGEVIYKQIMAVNLRELMKNINLHL